MPEKPKSDTHALYIGATLGSMMRFGLDANPVVDAYRDYTDGIELLLPELPEGTHVTVIVPEPPEGWTITDDVYQPDELVPPDAR